MVGSGPTSRGGVLWGEISPRLSPKFPAVLRLSYLDLRLLTPPVVVCGIACGIACPPPLFLRAGPLGCGASAVREARPEGARADCACVRYSLRELPSIFTGFGAPGEACSGACAPQGRVDVILGAPT